jgi:preprotein translocase subunit SecE
MKEQLVETYNELMHNVTWPTWKELQSSSILVLVASAIIAFLVFLMDYVFGINSDDSIWKGILGFVYQLLGDL